MRYCNTKRFNTGLRALAIGLSIGLTMTLTACGGGGGSDLNAFAATTPAAPPPAVPPPAASTYTVGGTVSGLNAGATLVLKNNASIVVTVTANGGFAFPGASTAGNVYAVTVDTRPNYQTCAISNGTGSIPSANVSNVSVVCTTNAQYAYVGNSRSNNISVYSINATTGALTQVPGSPFAMDPGAFSFPPGPQSGTGAITVNAAGTYAYFANSSSNNVSAYNIDAATGALTFVTGSPFAAVGSFPESVAVNPAGTYAYAPNTGSNNVSVYSIDATTGALTAVVGSPFGAGSSPVSVTVNPAGTYAYVANSGDNTVSAYSIDAATGALTPIAGSPFATDVGTFQPISVTVNSAGTYAYVVNRGSDNISVYSISAATGALTLVAGSPFATGGASPGAVAIGQVR